MADEDISLTEDQLLDNLDDTGNGDAEFLNEVNYSTTFVWKFFSDIYLPSFSVKIVPPISP